MARLQTEEELKAWIPRRLGSAEGQWGNPLTCEQFDDAIQEAKRWFTAKKGVIKELVLPLVPGQVEYAMPLDCDAVIDVAFESSLLDFSTVMQPSQFAGDHVPYNVFAPPGAGAGGLYSTILQTQQYSEMARNIIGADLKWEWRPYSRILLLWPSQRPGTCIIEYKSTSMGAIEQLPERDHDFIKRYALAWAKRDLGNIFSRYGSYPTAQGQMPVNGPQLLKDAEAEFAALDNEIAWSAMPMPFMAI